MAADDALQGQLFSGYGRPKAQVRTESPPQQRPSGPGPGQLPMLMSARQITQRYVPNEPDRFYHGTDISVRRASGARLPGRLDPRAGEETRRTSRTDQEPNFMQAGKPHGPYTRGRFPIKGDWAKPETDEQMYARKLGEAQRISSGSAKRSTLFKSIAFEGVHNPVALGHEEGTSRPDFVAGGHHRIGVMLHLNPDQLLPVMHVRSVGEAQGMGL